MKRITTLILLMLTMSVAFPQKGSITGKVVEPMQKTPLEFAGVGLLKVADSAVIRSEMTDNEGRFTLSSVPAGHYLIKVYFFGFKDWVSEPVTVGSEPVDLGEISLIYDVEMLQSVDIVYKKPLFEQKLGKTVMNVESQPSAAGDNVLELLRKMPGVTVDNSDNISIQGKSGALILIDDKDPHLSGDDLTNFLKSMPATMIDRVEVMKNPSARYDAAGTAGIINLVTKHDRNTGITGSVWAGADYKSHFGCNAGFNLTARVGKWVLNGSYYYMYNKSKNGFDGSTTSYLHGDTLRQTMNELADELYSNLSRFQSHGANFSADWYIDSVNTLSFSYRGNFFDFNWRSSSHNRLYVNDQLMSAFMNESETHGKHGNHQVNVNYKHSFAHPGTALFADVTYSIDQNRSSVVRNMPYYSDDFITEIRRDQYLRPDIPNPMHVVVGKLDLEHPINDAVSIEVGAKASYARNDNNSINLLNGDTLQEMSNHFLYEEAIAAAYVQGSFQLATNLTAQAGLRGEFCHLRGNLITTGEVNQQNYLDVFPSFQLDYQLPKMNNLSFALRSRISRPNYRSLNPHIDISDEYNLSSGNPYLQPEYMHTFSIDYSWRYMLFASLAYEYTRGTEENMMYTDKLTNVRLSRPENIGKMHAMRASMFLQVPVGKWWMMMWNVSYLLGKQTFEYETQTVSSLKSNVSLYTMHTFTFLKHYSIEVAAWWMPKQKETFGNTRGVFFAWGGFKANFLKDALTLRIGVSDIFNQSNWASSYVYPDGTETSERWIGRQRGVSVNLSYRFGNQRIQVRQRRSNDSEFGRMGGGDGGGQQGGGQQGGSQPGGGM